MLIQGCTHALLQISKEAILPNCYFKCMYDKKDFLNGGNKKCWSAKQVQQKSNRFTLAIKYDNRAARSLNDAHSMQENEKLCRMKDRHDFNRFSSNIAFFISGLLITLVETLFSTAWHYSGLSGLTYHFTARVETNFHKA